MKKQTVFYILLFLISIMSYDAMSQPVNWIIVFEHRNFGGAHVNIENVTHNWSRGSFVEFFNQPGHYIHDAVSSAKWNLPAGVCVTFYEHWDGNRGHGRQYTIWGKGQDPDMHNNSGSDSFGDCMSAWRWYRGNCPPKPEYQLHVDWCRNNNYDMAYRACELAKAGDIEPSLKQVYSCNPQAVNSLKSNHADVINYLITNCCLWYGNTSSACKGKAEYEIHVDWCWAKKRDLATRAIELGKCNDHKPAMRHLYACQDHNNDAKKTIEANWEKALDYLIRTYDPYNKTKPVCEWQIHADWCWANCPDLTVEAIKQFRRNDKNKALGEINKCQDIYTKTLHLSWPPWDKDRDRAQKVIASNYDIFFSYLNNKYGKYIEDDEIKSENQKGELETTEMAWSVCVTKEKCKTEYFTEETCGEIISYTQPRRGTVLAPSEQCKKRGFNGSKNITHYKSFEHALSGAKLNFSDKCKGSCW